MTATVRGYLVSLHTRAPSGKAFLLLWSEAVAGDPALAPLFADRDAWFRGLLRDLIAEGVRDGSVRPEADPDALAVVLLGLLRGVGLQLISTYTATPVTDEALGEIAEQTVDVLGRGLGSRRLLVG